MAKTTRLPQYRAGAGRPRRVCLVNPPTITAPRSLSYYGAVLPIGLAYVAAAARDAGHDVTVIDATGEAIDAEGLFPTTRGPVVVQGLSAEQIVERVPLDAEIVGVSHMFLHQWPWLAAFLTELKRARPGVLAVAGGENASAMWPHMLDTCDALDACVLGEGEHRFVALIDAGREGMASVGSVAHRGADGQPVRTEDAPRIADIDALPTPAWDLFPIEEYLSRGLSHGVQRGRSMPVVTSRGCPYRCTFCSSPQMWTTRYTRRDPARVVDEIEQYAARYGITNVDINDLTALLTKQWILEFCDEIEGRGLSVTWQLPSGTRSEAVDGEAARRLYAAGCRNFCYAPESGSPRTLDLIKKKVKIESLRASLRSAVDAGMMTHASIIIGFPHETRADLWQTFRLLMQLARDGAHGASVMLFNPYPGSEIYRDLLRQGRIQFDDAWFYSSLLRSAGTATSFHPTLSARDLLALQLLMLASFWSAQYALRPQRAARLAINAARRRQQMVMDQFIATKLRQLGRGLRRRLGTAQA